MLEMIKLAFSPFRLTLPRWARWSILKRAFASYRPERHYMRGSGPKSRAVHPQHPAQSPQG
jgi:hypothetical protein